MVNITIFLEGGATGADSRYLQARCREGFAKLIAKLGLKRPPSLKVCGGRGNAYKVFCVAHKNSEAGQFLALLVDSEDPIHDIEAPWQHLKTRDGWEKPKNATDEQVLLMTTCMETWIVADRDALRNHYGAKLQESALPSLQDMESRDRHKLQESLTNATKNCSNKYEKGKRSFLVLGELSPGVLSKHLPSFRRAVRLLKEKE